MLLLSVNVVRIEVMFSKVCVCPWEGVPHGPVSGPVPNHVLSADQRVGVFPRQHGLSPKTGQVISPDMTGVIPPTEQGPSFIGYGGPLVVK